MHTLSFNYRAMRLVREQRGLSKIRLSKISGLDRRSLARWEAGQQTPDLRTVGRLADALGCHPTALIEWAEVAE